MNDANLDHKRDRRAEEFERIGQIAVQKAQEESRRLGVPNVYYIDGVIYWELPNGELSTTDPGVWKVDTENPPPA